MQCFETERLLIREILEKDAEFILNLLNQPSFIEFIGDRLVRTVEEAQHFINERYRASYRENGYGLYTVELKEEKIPLGICGFVKRETLPSADLGFAFLPEFWNFGYAFESARGCLRFGKEVLGLKEVLAITTEHNQSSQKLLTKLGFRFEKLVKTSPEEDFLKLFSLSLKTTKN